jgi:pyruvate dehydrogenase E2 component (dihydrolipoamide acetyltransferase)
MSDWEPQPGPPVSGAPEPGAPEPGLKGVASIREPTRSERAVGRRTAETRATVPDLELGLEIDAGPALARADSEGCSLTTVLVSACAAALREHPRANGAYRDGHFELHSRVNVAVTVPTEDASVAPTLLDADTRSLAELEAELTRLGELAAAGELTAAPLAGATFTLTDLGPQGVHRGSPFITPPQAAAIAAGAVRSVPMVQGEAVRPGQALSLTLAADSRILFGAAAARFLLAVGRALESGRP